MLRKIIIILSLLFICCAWLSPFHANPWLMIVSEICAFLSLFCLIFFFKDKDIIIPRVILPVLFFSIIPFFQYFFGIELYFETALLCFSYLFCVFLSMIIGFNTASIELKERTLILLSGSILISSLISVIIILLQWFGLEKNIFLIAPLHHDRPFGNFAQPNNMATFLVFGLLSNLFLLKDLKITKKMASVFSFLILFAIALSYSRTAWIELIIIGVCLFFIQDKVVKKKTIYFYSVLFFIFLFTIPYLNNFLNGFGLGLLSTQNVNDRLSTGSLRLGIWKQMLVAIYQQPWFGYGWNQTAYAQIIASTTVFHSEQTRSAHNIILELLVWNGILIGSIIIFYALYLLKLVFFTSNQKMVLIRLIIVSFIVHALLEFPQNYACFLLIIAFLIGFLLRENYDLKIFQLNKKTFPIIFIFSIIIFGAIIRDYLNIKYIIANYNSEEFEKNEIKEEILILGRLDTMKNWVFEKKPSMMSDAKIKYYKNFIKTAPTEYNLINIVKILILNGRFEEARDYYKILYDLYHVNYTYDDIYKSVKNNQPIRVNEIGER
ncbi:MULTISPECIES: O-antigen ligase family protein [Acinetobacter]|uniref:O-antigen ligase family protein n=1 Tax=Acinetobacter TaxID=469 RepID=UPI000D007796|nr:O-antigen ligase family protein [Acinetobacter sp. MYb10]QLD61959.1 O-antigen ligase family protein [Acinetobacter sp. MYb10]